MFQHNQPVLFKIPATINPTFKILPAGHFQASQRKSNFYLNEAAGKNIAAMSLSTEVKCKVSISGDAEIPDSPAAGWFKNLVWRDDGLYVTDLKLTKKAQDLITNREYLYFSPIFYRLADIPKQIVGLVITNDPELRARNYGK